jgi:cytochrome b pre-mRNA-processing protein 3
MIVAETLPVSRDRALTYYEAMIFRLFRRDPQAATITALYGVIVAQARVPAFYIGFGVPDTPEGRFELLVLHLALVCRRLGGTEGAEQASARALSQGVFDMFCRDMDHNLREMGVGDLTVPKTMRKLGEAFYGRLEAYDRALASADPADLAAALARNAQGPEAPVAAAEQLAAYVRAAAARLDALPIARLRDGEVSFPDPAMMSPPICEAQA